ncbi:MAG: hypothetical protein ACR2QW_00960, partial [bacterium]
YGYSVSGRNRAKLNDSVLKALEAFGLVNSVKTQSAHNSYLAMLVKFGAVGLLLLIALMAKPMLRARRLVFSERVPIEEKAVFVFPASLSLLLAFTSFFEDTISSYGRGTLTGALLFSTLIILDNVGKKLEAKYLLNTVKAPQKVGAPKARLAHQKLAHSDNN